MNQEAQKRKDFAEEINEKIRDMTKAVIIVGSVAFSPDKVSPESDLDMVCILDFKKIDFKEFYSRLNQEFEPLITKHAAEGKFNNFSIVWEVPGFEVGLHLWDITAFENVINLKNPNIIFKRKNWKKEFKSTALAETLYNLKGEKKTFEKPYEEVEGGQLIQFPAYFEDESGFYPGIQLCNLILNPVILSEEDKYASDGIKSFKENLKKKFADAENISFYNALDPKLKEKLPVDLKEKLESFLRH